MGEENIDVVVDAESIIRDLPMTENSFSVVM